MKQSWINLVLAGGFVFLLIFINTENKEKKNENTTYNISKKASDLELNVFTAKIDSNNIYSENIQHGFIISEYYKLIKEPLDTVALKNYLNLKNFNDSIVLTMHKVSYLNAKTVIFFNEKGFTSFKVREYLEQTVPINETVYRTQFPWKDFYESVKPEEH